MENSVKQEIFDIMIEGILNQRTLLQLTEGELQADKSDIVIISNEKLIYLHSVPFVFNGKYIHGNVRNLLVKEFIEKYPFNYLKNIYDKKMESDAIALEKHLNLEEENKYKLEELYEEIKTLNKYSKRNNEGVKWIYLNSGLNSGKYCIEFNCKKDQWNTETIEITNNNMYNKYVLFISSENMRQELTHDELVVKINELTYEIYYQSCKAEKEASILANNQKLKIINKLEELYNISSINEILFKNKKSFIGYRKGVRYAVGEGKTGKYYNCDKYQLQKLIITKGIMEYYIIDKDVKTYGMTNKELLNLPYQIMI